VGRIAAALFFFHGSLAYVNYLWEFNSFGEALTSITGQLKYLNSGFGYHGEDWGLWTMNVYINQRHLIGPIGVLALVLLSFVKFQKRCEDAGNGELDSGVSAKEFPRSLRPDGLLESTLLSKNAELVFCGLLIGLLPLWNGAVYISAGLILGVLFLLGRNRVSQLWLLVPAIIVAIPQLLFLRSDTVDPQQSYPAFFWGFNVTPPTLLNVLSYVGVTFGFKLLLVAIALFLAKRFDRILFLAFTSLVVITFTFKFSFEVLANHKFINIWVVFINIFVAYGLYRLWISSKAGKAGAIALALLIVPGGIIDMIPIHNVPQILTRFDEEPLVVWIDTNTPKDSVFLTEHYADHPLLFSGRKIFQGYTYFTSAAGYPADARGIVYDEMLKSKDPGRLWKLLNENGIDYVAFDDSLRNAHLKGQGNESVYAQYFQLVYDDVDHRYENMKIYRVADPIVAIPQSNEPARTVANTVSTDTPHSPDMSGPRGIAVDADGNYYVTDTGNARVHKFDADGLFVSIFGVSGRETGEFKDPNGILTGPDGNIYVSDAGNNKLMKFSPDGTFINEWLGPDNGFYGPRDIALGPNKQIYIVDQGRTRIVRFDTLSETFTLSWGTTGQGEGQLYEPTGITVVGNLVFVMDTGNERIEVFDLDGKYIRQWAVPEWVGYSYRYPDAVYDELSKRLFVTSSGTNEVLAFSLEGDRLDGIKPDENKQLDSPSSLAIAESKSRRRLLVLSTKGATVTTFDLETKVKKK
jgi:DNA-binding beta-propeller fold protein YncE